MEPGTAWHIDDDRNSNLGVFWVASFSPARELADVLREIKCIFIDSMWSGVQRHIPGVRDTSDPTIDDDNSPTLLIFRGTDEAAEIWFPSGVRDPFSSYFIDPTRRIHRSGWRSISWSPVGDGNWDAFERDISIDIEKRWPRDFGELAPTGGPEGPICFPECWECFRGASMTLAQLSYDEQGFPKEVYRTSWRRGCQISDGLNALPCQPRQIFGMSWRVSPEGTALDFTLLAFVVYLLTLAPTIMLDDIGYSGLAFAKRYAGPWPTAAWKRWCCLDAGMCHLQFHLRFLSISDANTHEYCSEGLHIYRDRGWISSPETGNNAAVVENRVAIAINTSIESESAPYSLVTLTDLRGLSPHRFGYNQAYETLLVNVCGNYTGVAVFQVALWELLRDWWEIWGTVLNAISGTLGMEPHIDDIIDPQEWDRLTYRRPSTKSELYATMSRLLRISSKWIRQTKDDLESLVEDFNGHGATAQTVNVIRANWRSLMLNQVRMETDLLKRISEETNKINLLQQGIEPEW